MPTTSEKMPATAAVLCQSADATAGGGAGLAFVMTIVSDTRPPGVDRWRNFSRCIGRPSSTKSQFLRTRFETAGATETRAPIGLKVDARATDGQADKLRADGQHVR